MNHEAVDRRMLLRSLAGMGLLGAAGRVPLADAVAESGPIARTRYGKVRGVAARGVLSFRGIPYGGPADGRHRFLPPGAPVPWTGVREATHAGPRAPQGKGSIFSSALIGDYFSGARTDAVALTDQPDSENCLVLNVLTTSLQGKRPVMVYIHGGGFIAGSGALTLISDRFVADQDVVLVGVNHRLNVFGYTYLGGIDPVYADSGNAGQLDLIAALRWVRENIAEFGGDPGNVTLFGESGGGAKISALLAMPEAKGLFRRAIIESGSFRRARTRESAMADTGKLLAKLQITPANIGELRTLPAARLLSAYEGTVTGIGGPVIDGRSVPHATWQDGAPPEAAGVPLLIGCCKDETTLFALDDHALHSLDWEGLKARQVAAGIPADKADAIVQLYRTRNPHDSPSDLYFRIATDKGFRAIGIKQAESAVRQGSAAHMYYFAWSTGLSEGRLRAFHTAELPLAMRLVANPQAEELSKQLAGAWAAFARTGDPSHAGIPRWEPYSLERRATLVFDAGRTALVHNPAREELALLAPYPKGYPYEDEPPETHG